MKVKLCCLAAALALAFLLPAPAAAANDEASAPAPALIQVQEPDACLDYTPAGDPEAQPALLLGPADMEPVAPTCKRCKDQPFCDCTYPGGYHRVSCDPCCYVNSAGFRICTS